MRGVKFRLTGRGILVAARLSDLVRIISGESVDEKGARIGSQESKLLDEAFQKILDCVDAALESFGANFSRFTHANLSIVEGLQRRDIIGKSACTLPRLERRAPKSLLLRKRSNGEATFPVTAKCRVLLIRAGCE